MGADDRDPLGVAEVAEAVAATFELGERISCTWLVMDDCVSSEGRMKRDWLRVLAIETCDSTCDIEKLM